jgi:hypothetical protein
MPLLSQTPPQHGWSASQAPPINRHVRQVVGAVTLLGSLSQIPLQHSLSAVQVAPIDPHVGEHGGRQTEVSQHVLTTHFQPDSSQSLLVEHVGITSQGPGPGPAQKPVPSVVSEHKQLGLPWQVTAIGIPPGQLEEQLQSHSVSGVPGQVPLHSRPTHSSPSSQRLEHSPQWCSFFCRFTHLSLQRLLPSGQPQTLSSPRLMQFFEQHWESLLHSRPKRLQSLAQAIPGTTKANAAPRSAPPIYLIALPLERVPVASPLASSSKERSTPPPCGRPWCERSLLCSSVGILPPPHEKAELSFLPRHAVRRPGYLPKLSLGGPWALRPRLTAGLPFSLAHTRMRIPCYDHTIHRFAAPRNTPWRLLSAYGRCPVLHLAEKREGPEHPYGRGPELCEFLRTPSPRSSQNSPSRQLGE